MRRQYPRRPHPQKGAAARHITMIVHNVTTAGYFIMVLVGASFDGLLVLLGITQALMNPCAIMEARLWIYE